MRKTRLTLAAATVTALMAAGPAQAQLSTPQPVAGTTANTLAIGATTPAVLQNFAPGQTATSLAPSPMTVISTSGWTLQAADAPNGGHLQAAAVGCAGSAAQTANQLEVTSSGAGVTHLGQQVIGTTGVSVATGSLAQVFDVSYSLDLDPTEQLLSGCVYETEVTWTVQP